MNIRLDLFERHPEMKASMSRDQAYYFNGFIGEVAATLESLRKEIEAEERACRHGHIFTIVNLLAFETITVFHVGYSPSLTDRMHELVSAMDFDIVKNNLWQESIRRNN